jgi:hypothetical protein
MKNQISTPKNILSNGYHNVQVLNIYGHFGSAAASAAAHASPEQSVMQALKSMTALISPESLLPISYGATTSKSDHSCPPEPAQLKPVVIVRVWPLFLTTLGMTWMPHSMPPLGHVTEAETPLASEVDQLVGISLGIGMDESGWRLTSM